MGRARWIRKHQVIDAVVRGVIRAGVFCATVLFLLSIVSACRGSEPGSQPWRTSAASPSDPAFELRSVSFQAGGQIPRELTCDGDDNSPLLTWTDPPSRTESFALIVDDPDAPGGTWNHWLLWDVPAHVHTLAEDFRPGSVGASGKNDFGRLGYGGPCPPKGHGVHRYRFTVLAADRPVLGLPPGAKRPDLDRALKGRILAQAQYLGRYGRR